MASSSSKPPRGGPGQQGLSQTDLARLVGVSRQTISAIETGLFNPTAKLALVLCIALDKKGRGPVLLRLARIN